jgi:hypothetical protein
MGEELMKSKAEEINRLHKDWQRTTLDKFIQIGKLLTQCKETIDHGEWMQWMKGNLSFSQQMASVYMRAYERRDDPKLLSDSNLMGLERALIEHKPKKKAAAPTPEALPVRLQPIVGPKEVEEAEEDEQDGLFDAVKRHNEKIRHKAAQEKPKVEVAPSTPPATPEAEEPEVAEVEWEKIEDDPQDEALKLVKEYFKHLDMDRKLEAIKVLFTALDTDSKNLFLNWVVDLREAA